MSSPLLTSVVCLTLIPWCYGTSCSPGRLSAKQVDLNIEPSVLNLCWIDLQFSLFIRELMHVFGMNTFLEYSSIRLLSLTKTSFFPARGNWGGMKPT